MGAGMSGEVATIQQARSDNEEFSHKQVWIQTAVGAVGGALTGGIAAGGGALAAGATSTIGRVGIQLGSATIGGAAGGGGANLTSCALTGEEVSAKEVGKAVVLGGLGGFIGGGLGQAVGSIVKDEIPIVLRTLIGAGAGSGTSALTALSIKITENILRRTYIVKADISEIIGFNPDTVERIWAWLIQKEYIMLIKEERKQNEEGKADFKAKLRSKCRDLGDLFVE